VTLFVFGGCTFSKRIGKIRKIAPETESGYIFVGAYGLTSENVYEPYSKFVRKLVSDKKKGNPYETNFGDEKAYYLYNYNSHGNDTDWGNKYTFDVGLFSTEYRTKKTVLHKDFKGVKPDSTVKKVRPRIFSGIADNHALLNYNGKLEILDLDTNETVFSEAVEDGDKFTKEIKRNLFIGYHYLILENDTAVLYEYKGDYFLKHVFASDKLKGVSGWLGAGKIIIGDVLLLYYGGVFKYGVNFQTGEEISHELGTDLMPPQYGYDYEYENENDEAYQVTVGGETYTYESLPDVGIKITRESDQETRIVDYGFLRKKSAAFEQIESFWLGNRLSQRYEVFVVEGKILAAYWAIKVTSPAPTYFFEYDFDGNFPLYAGMYEDDYNVDTSKVYRIIRVEK
jgi:hypothetical protein